MDERLKKYHREYNLIWRVKHPLRYRAYILRGRAKYRAKCKGLDFNVSSKWIHKRLKRGCALTGLPFDFSGDMGPYSPSLDRIDPQRGYMEDNIQVILFGINALKHTGSMEDVYDIARALLGEDGKDG